MSDISAFITHRSYGSLAYRSMAEEQEQLEALTAELKVRRQQVRQQQAELEGARKAWKADMKALNSVRHK